MALLSVLISLFIERFLGSLEELRRFHWFSAYVTQGRALLSHRWLQGVPQLLLLLAPPLLATAYASHLLYELLLLFGFGFSVLVLLYSFGPRDLEAEVEAFVDACRRGDKESASWYASTLLNGGSAEEGRLGESVMRVVLVQANLRIFGVILWFLLLGPMGALLFRLVESLQPAGEAETPFEFAARRLFQILNWPSARLCALGYGLSGSLSDALARWRANDRGLESSDELLAAVGFAALQYQPEDGGEENQSDNIEETLTLVRRTALLWLSALALMTLVGWAG